MSCSEWKKGKVRSFISLKNGKKRPSSGANYPVYGGNGIIDFTDKSNAEDCIIIGRVGAYCGNVYYAPDKVWVSDNAIIGTPKKNNEVKYLYYLLSYLNLNHSRIGGAQPLLTQNIIYDIEVDYPFPDEQRRIAAVLSSLDDKIELNNRINANLEEQAQAIFKSWFVDFEPFQDGEFTDSPLGKIPKGWKVGRLEDIGEVVGGGTPSKAKPEYYAEDGIAWVTPKDLSLNKNKFISKGLLDISNEGLARSSARIMPKGSILFSSRAPIGYIAIAKNDISTNQGFRSVVPYEDIGSAFVYETLKFLTSEIKNKATGSTFKEASGSLIKSIETIIPPEKILRPYNALNIDLLLLQEALEAENEKLASLRDTLLPKLMSGELRVEEIENVVP